MNYLKVKKLEEEAVIPTLGTVGSAGYDLTATSVRYDEEFDFIEYGTGISVQIPEGFVGLVFPRSSISNTDLALCNSVAVIDSDYRGELKCRFYIKQTYTEVAVEFKEGIFLDGDTDRLCFQAYETPQDFYNKHLTDYKIYSLQDRIAQLVIMPCINPQLIVVTELSETVRNAGGFGSTGN